MRINKANRMVGAIRRSFTCLDKFTFVKLYKSMVRVHLENAVPVWFPYMIKDIEMVEAVQRRATKMLPETKGLEYVDRLRLLKLPTLAYRRHRGDMIELYKMINEVYDKDVLPSFEMRGEVVTGSRENRGHSKQLFITRSYKDVRKNFFTKRAAPLWNSLTEEVVTATSVDMFKRGLDKLWENQPVKYNYEESILF